MIDSNSWFKAISSPSVPVAGKHDPMGMPLQGISQEPLPIFWVVFYDQNPHG